jgi:hypothetical protein
MRCTVPAPRHLQRLWLLPRQRKILLVVAAWTLACTAWRVRRWRFARLAATLGTAVPATAPCGVGRGPEFPASHGDQALAREVQWAIAAWVKRLHPAPTCLMQAAAAQRMLARRGLSSILFFGVQSLASSAVMPAVKTPLGAHAWLCCAGLLVTGEREAASFRPIAAYERVGATGPL